ncbi:MAG: geranylgeranyl diphosphate synthase, type [Thermoplasmata archaeon]|jgi:geranylgeranyl diphosphate synthase type I|nr:geranylgeranyl diphosphate synthase, type [Thermoplasmata archaeon]
MNLEAALRPYLEQFNDEMDKYLVKRELKPVELYDAIRHLPIKGGGKRLRPIVAILSAQAVGGDSKKIMPYGVALEILHSFTLIHDDIMDECDTRRGLPAVHAKWGVPMGILAGDTMFAMLFEILDQLEIDDKTYRSISLDVAKLAREVCEGQYWDMFFESQKKIEELQYYHMIERKTATFFEIAMKNGAELGAGEPQQVKKLAECGRLMGLAFQVWDDYLGVVGKAEETGKPARSDILQGKKTLVYVATHTKLDPFDRRQFVDLYKKEDKTEKEIAEILKFMEKSGGLEFTRLRAREFSSFAKATLADLPETAAKRLLLILCDFASNRTK